MSLKRYTVLVVLLLLALLLSACNPGTAPLTPQPEQSAQDQVQTEGPSSQTSQPEKSVQEEVKAGEFLHISGEGVYVSDPFTLEGPGVIKVYFRQETTEFLLLLRNTNETLAAAPYGTVTFAIAFEPTEYVEDDPHRPPFEYIPGEYVFDISANGPWEVWAVVEYPEGQ